MSAFNKANGKERLTGYLKMESGKSGAMETNTFVYAGLILFSILFSTACAIFIRDVKRLLRINRNSYLVRRVGHLSIFINEALQVPFSYWLPGQANIVLPMALVTNREKYDIALKHELQHHRNRDTRWAYVLWTLRVCCIVNPFVYLWTRWISELQEFACDETLVDQKNVDSQAYARCLFEVAQSALNFRDVPGCATGLTLLVKRDILKRRVQKMFCNNVITAKRSISLSFALVLVIVMGITAYASTGVIQDRRVTLAQAEEMVRKAKSDSEFPLVVNDLVLKQLNRYIGTPEGREFMRQSLQRMEAYRPVIEAKIQHHKVPSELMAIPITESGYQNIAHDPKPNQKPWGSGLWMFIKSTARNYGLRVNKHVDDRMNVELETDAAMRYLSANKAQFNDWLLAVLAYNCGESKVQKGIEKTGSRDAWTLIRQGVSNDEDYLAKFMAAVLIMKNPKVVQ